ncbi:hypothetical protein PS720_06408 [Pseudomonas fluorescens]|nr:hypothetical protein PS720_06408 [Pseudomonas fluorescens]
MQGLGVKAQHAVTVTGEGLQHVAQGLVVDLEQATGPGVGIGIVDGLRWLGAAVVEDRALASHDLDPIGGAAFDRYRGLDHRDHRGAICRTFDQITRAQRSGRALVGADHKGPLRILRHVYPELALQQFDHALMAVEFHVHRRIAVELQLAAVLKGDLSALADTGALVGHPDRQVLQAQPTA